MKKYRWLSAALLVMTPSMLFAADASKVTTENFHRLRAGMTQAQVQAILGEPDEETDEGEGDPYTLWNGKEIEICLWFGEDGRLETGKGFVSAPGTLDGNELLLQAEEDATDARMFPDGRDHDFGTVNRGPILQYAFRIVNTAEVPLRITRWYVPACAFPGGGSVSKDVLQPHEEGKLAVTVDTSRFVGSKTAKCFLYVGGRSKEFGFWLTATSVEEQDKTTMFPEGLSHDFGPVECGVVLKHAFRIVNTSDVPLHIKGLRGGMGCMTGSVNKEVLERNEVGNLEFTMDTRRFHGARTVWWFLTIEQQGNFEEVRLSFSANSIEKESGPVTPLAKGEPGPMQWPKDWSVYLGKRITVEGMATNPKVGPALSGNGEAIFIDGMNSWPDDFCLGDRGKRLRVTGTVIERHDLPVFIWRKGQPPLSGIPVPEGTDLHKASRRFLLQNAKWIEVE
jgi:hypothetical protein